MSRRLLLMFTLTGSFLLATGIAQADHDTAIYLAAGPALDNTETNARDKSGTTLTPEEQKETKTDIRITAHIRKAVVKNKWLSLDAKNAKIITRNGVVTLRGPVANAAESAKLQKIATQTRGVMQVDNQLDNKAP
ncbi:BON domain-containing protein [Methylovulum psychrotolerans]|uniref:BON domain-containing protein n=1 Tax=Methylovulum psychrotolerans TaxID=1704499 RepID=UPI001BFF2CFF|nr:BON domain-containing protein [Methylovulum psychrotolerans]MBT9100402.1 BON domain-containing protein [Methylovulum psychrotolerans]